MICRCDPPFIWKEEHWNGAILVEIVSSLDSVFPFKNLLTVPRSVRFSLGKELIHL
jgi:hypothetical protein